MKSTERSIHPVELMINISSHDDEYAYASSFNDALSSDFNLIFVLCGWVFVVIYCCRYIYFNISLLLEEKSFAVQRTYSLVI